MSFMEGMSKAGIAYTIYGDVERKLPWVILVPGGVSRAAIANRGGALPKLLSLQYKVLLYDPRGFNGSNRLGHTESLEQMADDQENLIKEICGEEQVHAFGYSFGTMICMAHARKYPDRMLSLGLLSPYFEQQSPKWTWQYRALNFGVRNKLLMTLVLGIGACFTRDSRKRKGSFKFIGELRRADPTHILAMTRALQTFGSSYWENLPQKIPLCIMRGSRDHMSDDAQWCDIKERVPWAEEFEDEDADHTPLDTHLTRYILAYLTFLQAVEAKRVK